MPSDANDSAGLVVRLGAAARPFASPDDFTPLIDAIGDARFVLLGEATHGTSEFYTARAELSKRLIAEKGFSFVAVEGDWPDCYRVNRYVKAMANAEESADDVLHAFARWPTWMWANREVVAERQRLEEDVRKIRARLRAALEAIEGIPEDVESHAEHPESQPADADATEDGGFRVGSA